MNYIGFKLFIKIQLKFYKFRDIYITKFCHLKTKNY